MADINDYDSLSAEEDSKFKRAYYQVAEERGVPFTGAEDEAMWNELCEVWEKKKAILAHHGLLYDHNLMQIYADMTPYEVMKVANDFNFAVVAWTDGQRLTASMKVFAKLFLRDRPIWDSYQADLMSNYSQEHWAVVSQAPEGTLADHMGFNHRDDEETQIQTAIKLYGLKEDVLRNAENVLTAIERLESLDLEDTAENRRKCFDQVAPELPSPAMI